MYYWLLLFAAILCEVVGTTALKMSDGFTKPLVSTVVVLGYAAAFYLFSLTLKAIPVGVAYAVWSGIGIAAIAVIGWLWFGQLLDKAALAGIAMILGGVAVINLFSNTVR